MVVRTLLVTLFYTFIRYYKLYKTIILTKVYLRTNINSYNVIVFAIKYCSISVSLSFSTYKSHQTLSTESF